jgi:hypothetical protein
MPFIQISQRGVHEIGKLSVTAVSFGDQCSLATALSCEAGAAGVRHPDLHGAEARSPKGFAALLDAF